MDSTIIDWNVICFLHLSDTAHRAECRLRHTSQPFKWTYLTKHNTTACNFKEETNILIEKHYCKPLNEVIMIDVMRVDDSEWLVYLLV